MNLILVLVLVVIAVVSAIINEVKGEQWWCGTITKADLVGNYTEQIINHSATILTCQISSAMTSLIAYSTTCKVFFSSSK